jgi:hypothetical protein
MQIFIYNDLVFLERYDARSAASLALRKSLGAEGDGVSYEWETNPIVCLEHTGIIWRGYCVVKGLRFSADVVAHRVGG